MYKFRDTNEFKTDDNQSSIMSIIDGVNLDTVLDGYKTLNVSGRGNIARNINTLAYQTGKDSGRTRNRTKDLAVENKFLGSVISGRAISVEFQLKSCHLGDNEGFRRLTEELIFYANKEEVWIKFTDDPYYSFKATCREITLPKEDRNSLVGEMIFDVVDPFKYSDPLIYEFGTGKTFEFERYYEPLIEDYNLEVINNAEQIVIENATQGYKLILNGSYNQGQTINIGETEITSQGRNITNNLDYNADWEDFSIENKDNILVENATLEITYRERML